MTPSTDACVTNRETTFISWQLIRPRKWKLAKNPKMISYFGFASANSENSIDNECRAYSIKNNKMLDENRGQ